MKKEHKKAKESYSDLFSGILGQEYDMLKLICPLATEMSRLVGAEIAKYQPKNSSQSLSIVELGGGTGITTLSILLANNTSKVLSIDNALTMQNQAKASLNQWIIEDRLQFSLNDILTELIALPENSVEIIASAYTLHNFESEYRNQVHQQIFRVLKPGGLFVNGDRYGLDDIAKHTQTIQNEVAGYFKVLTHLNKLDVLEHWIIHLFNDESENHVMRESRALQQLSDIGFTQVTLSNRIEVNALVTAIKL